MRHYYKIRVGNYSKGDELGLGYSSTFRVRVRPLIKDDESVPQKSWGRSPISTLLVYA